MAKDARLEAIERRGNRAATVLAVLLLLLLVAGYNLVWTYFHDTGVWNLFAITAILLVAFIPVVTSFRQQQNNIERAYINKIQELLLQHHLRSAPKDAEVRSVATIHTLSVFEQLGTFSRAAKGRLLLFLYRSELINRHNPIVSMANVEVYNAACTGMNLSGADLRNVSLHNAKLMSATLREADLSGAQLDGANLMWANLENADLQNASLQGCKLQQAVLRGANLTGATIDEKALQTAYLDQTIMPDGTVHRA